MAVNAQPPDPLVPPPDPLPGSLGLGLALGCGAGIAEGETRAGLVDVLGAAELGGAAGAVPPSLGELAPSMPETEPATEFGEPVTGGNGSVAAAPAWGAADADPPPPEAR